MEKCPNCFENHNDDNYKGYCNDCYADIFGDDPDFRNYIESKKGKEDEDNYDGTLQNPDDLPYCNEY